MSGVMRVALICMLVGGCALFGPRERSADTSAETSAAPPDAEQQVEPGDDPGDDTSAEPGPGLPAITVASLGDVTRPGLWMRTPLVTAPMRGRVSVPDTGRAVVLDLIPLDAAPGAGSRMSLAAYRELNLPLTALPELRVEPAG